MRSYRNRILAGVVGLLLIGGLSCLSVSHAKNGDDKAMLLQIYFSVAKERADDFEKMFRETYVPALRKQEGYIRSNLIRIFPENVQKEIQAAETPYNYQIQLVFDTEENRRKWVDSPEHQKAWPLASGMAEKFAWRGYDLVSSDRNQ